MAALAHAWLRGTRNPHVLHVHSGFCVPDTQALAALAAFFKSISTHQKGIG